MKPTLDWLGDFVDLPTSDPEEIAAALDSLGLKVESWEPIQQRFSGVVIGRVLEVSPHPDADKVRLTRVDVGGEVLDIVCGAWNFREGAVVRLAHPPQPGALQGWLQLHGGRIVEHGKSRGCGIRWPPVAGGFRWHCLTAGSDLY